MLTIEDKNLQVHDLSIPYIKFGNGDKVLVMLPGIGDAFKTVKGLGLPFAYLYRSFAKDYTVYVFSRPQKLKAHTTTQEMAKQVYKAMHQLKLNHAYVIGVSQGGMIAQWLAIDYPQMVDKLALVVTAARSNPCMQKVISNWITLAKQNRYYELLLDTSVRSYTKKTKLEQVLTSYFTSLVKPKSFQRFYVQAESCLTHNAYHSLSSIQCPVLIIGGEKDGIVTGEASRELYEQIPNSILMMYREYSHGLYEEAKDFLMQIINFGKET